MKRFLGAAILYILTISLVTAHGDLDVRIVKATEDISKDPENKDLYFHRGKLYYQHEEYQKGILDFNTAVEKGDSSELINLFKSKCFFELGDYASAETEIKNFFSKNAHHVVAHNLHAKILFKQGDFHESALKYEYVIQKTIRPLPENYIDAANSWQTLEDEYSIDYAVKILKDGIENLGPIISLQHHLISILTQNKRYEEAISFQINIIENLNRKESGYYALHEIYLQNGDKDGALKALKDAEVAWNQLPQRLKKNSAMITLKQNILDKTNNLTF